MSINQNVPLSILAIKPLTGGGGGGGSVTSVGAVGNNGVTTNVANPTTAPVVTIGLDNITPNSVAATGTVTGSNLSGVNTGDQTITLTGDVTGTGTGTFATTIANDVNLAGNPTTTTQILTDNSTRIATTQFVQSLVSQISASLLYVTVGAGGQYANFTAAYNAGFSWFYAVGDFTQTTQFAFTRSIRITIGNNVNVTFNPLVSNPVRYNGLLTTDYIILECEGNGIITWYPTTGGGIPFLSCNPGSTINFINGNINLDFSLATSGTFLFSNFSRINDYYGYGITNIKLPDKGSSGFSFVSNAILGKVQENSIISIVGGGVNCAGCFTVSSNEKIVSLNEINLYGTFSPTANIINITNNKTNLAAINFAPDIAQTGNMVLSGNIFNVINPQNNIINTSIGATNTNLQNIDLGTGVLNVNNFAGVRLYNINASSITNQATDTFFSSTAITGLANNDNNNTGITYIGGNFDVDGTWRYRVVGTDLLYERREAGVWVLKQTILA